MTEIHLQETIKEVLQKEIFSKLTIFKPGEMQVFLQDIPLSTDFESENGDDDDKYFPCCVVKLRGGEIKTASAPQLTTVEIIVGVKDWAKDLTGYQSLMIIIQRIRDYFTEHFGIEGKFRLVYPIQWNIDEEVSAPYFLGSVITVWQTDVMPFNDPNNFL